MPQLKIISGDRQILPVGTPGTLQLQVADAAGGPVTVEFSCRSEEVTIEPPQITLEGDGVGEVQVLVASGDRKHHIEATITGGGEDAPKATFTVRSLDESDGSLAAAGNLIRDLGQLGVITDEALARRLSEELRAAGQAVRNTQDKLEARVEAIGDAAMYELIQQRLGRLHGRNP